MHITLKRIIICILFINSHLTISMFRQTIPQVPATALFSLITNYGTRQDSQFITEQTKHIRKRFATIISKGEKKLAANPALAASCDKAWCKENMRLLAEENCCEVKEIIHDNPSISLVNTSLHTVFEEIKSDFKLQQNVCCRQDNNNYNHYTSFTNIVSLAMLPYYCKWSPSWFIYVIAHELQHAKQDQENVVAHNLSIHYDHSDPAFNYLDNNQSALLKTRKEVEEDAEKAAASYMQCYGCLHNVKKILHTQQNKSMRNEGYLFGKDFNPYMKRTHNAHQVWLCKAHKHIYKGLRLPLKNISDYQPNDPQLRKKINYNPLKDFTDYLPKTTECIQRHDVQ